MSMHGVDIAGYQEGIDVRSLTADFVIVKATEGVQGTIYNPDYREMADAALASGKLLGFYHYANGGNPIDEADSFYESIRDYKGKAIPCLDWEGTGNPVFCSGMDVQWCKSFLDRIAERMGATPMLYTSKNICNTYDWSPCATYPLWGAQYAYKDHVYQDYESKPWQSAMGWGAWGHDIAIHQYGYVLPKPNDGGVGALDGDICYLTREEWQRMCGTKGDDIMRVSIADVAAKIHYDMVTDERNGYSQSPRWGNAYGITKTLVINGRQYSYAPGEFDCSSSCILAWRLALQGTKYEGALDAATYTGDMRSVFVNSGLFTASYTPAKRGDLYLSDGHHVAMCQDGGKDGVFGYDCLSEFNRNENHAATGGKAGDQDGQESVLRAYYNYPWSTVLHYNGRADYEVGAPSHDDTPRQEQSEARNINGLKYAAHVQSIGWCPMVHDGQTAGTVGYAKRLEALRINPPDGVRLDVHIKLDGIGILAFDNITAGSQQTIGTTGQGRMVETISIRCIQNSIGKKLRYQTHSQTVGWGPVCSEGQTAGVDGKRLEAIRMWFE